MSKTQIVVTRSHAARFATRLVFALLIGLACCFAQNASAFAADKKPNFGRIEITTNPAGYPILLDGQPAGETSTTGRTIELTPGHHTVEIVMPNGARWVREFNIVAGRKLCVAVSYKPKTITIAKSPCPFPVSVSAPASVNDGDVITFSSNVTYGGTSALNYTWTVSPSTARIISGAGTPTITVDTTGLGKQRVSAILMVNDGSGDRACSQWAQAATNIAALTPPAMLSKKFDEFPSVAFDDDKARLDNLAIELQNAPTAQGYIIVYSGRRSRSGQAERLGERARLYLVNTRGIDASRLTIVNGGYRESDVFELWIVPQGVQPPQPTPSVQPGDIQLTPDNTRRTRRSRP